eukprot:gene13277-9119_t
MVLTLFKLSFWHMTDGSSASSLNVESACYQSIVLCGERTGRAVLETEETIDWLTMMTEMMYSISPAEWVILHRRQHPSLVYNQDPEAWEHFVRDLWGRKWRITYFIYLLLRRSEAGILRIDGAQMDQSQLPQEQQQVPAQNPAQFVPGGQPVMGYPPSQGTLFQQLYNAQTQPQYVQPVYMPTPMPNAAASTPVTQAVQQSGTGAAPVYGAPPPIYYAPPPPPPVVLTPPVEDENYYKGFHDAVVRPNGPVWGTASAWVAPLVVNLAIFFGPLWYFRRRFAAQTAGKTGKGMMDSVMEMMSPMKSRDFRTEVKGTKFKDVIGIPEAKEELKQYVDFLKEPSRFTSLGARLPKGCLLTGQPGTGKTLLARAVAGEASTPFFSCSGADFIEIFGGSGPKRVRQLFEQARKAAPCVVFIDEIDALGSRNQGGASMGGGGGSEDNRTINQLLSELDGLNSKEPIVVVAATNYPEAIDKALLRDGRFDRKVNIPMPDKAARKELFEFYLGRVVTGDPTCKPVFQQFKKSNENGEEKENATSTFQQKEAVPGLKILPDVSNAKYAAKLADRTPGVSPAQISTIVNEAALEAATTDCEVVPLDKLQDAIDDVLIGKKHRQRMSGDSLVRTAYHEVGHCLMAWLSPLQKDVVKISIIPRGRAGGYTQQIQDEAMEPQTKESLFSQMCVLMGGRVAEKIFQKDISTGAMDDLQRATRLAMDILLKSGMSSSIGQLAFKPNEKNDGRAWMTWSEELHAKVEAEAREMTAAAFALTERTILENKEKHIKLAELLLEKKELDKDDIISAIHIWVTEFPFAILHYLKQQPKVVRVNYQKNKIKLKSRLIMNQFVEFPCEDYIDCPMPCRFCLKALIIQSSTQVEMESEENDASSVLSGPVKGYINSILHIFDSLVKELEDDPQQLLVIHQMLLHYFQKSLESKQIVKKCPLLQDDPNPSCHTCTAVPEKDVHFASEGRSAHYLDPLSTATTGSSCHVDAPWRNSEDARRCFLDSPARRSSGSGASPKKCSVARSVPLKKGLTCSFWVHLWPCFGMRSACLKPTRVFVKSAYRYIEDITEGVAKELQCMPAASVLYEPHGKEVRSLFELRPEEHYLLFPSGGFYRREAVPLNLLKLLVTKAKRHAGSMFLTRKMQEKKIPVLKYPFDCYNVLLTHSYYGFILVLIFTGFRFCNLLFVLISFIIVFITLL